MAAPEHRYYKKLTIDHTKIDSDLSHFPLPVPLGSSVGMDDQDVTDIFDEVGSDYLKIAITKDDGETPLYVEVEQWDDSEEKALLWVSRDNWDIAADSDTEIYLYFDSSASDNTDYVGDPGDRPEVWHSDFKAVHTMAQDPSGGTDCIIDSTGNENHGTPSGSMTSGDLVDGLIGKALDLDGDNDAIKIDSPSWHFYGQDSFSFGCLLYWDGATDTWQGIFQSHNPEHDVSTDNPPYGAFIDDSEEISFLIQDSNNDAHNLNNHVISSSTWHRAVFVRDSASEEMRIYVDGSLEDSMSFTEDIYDKAGDPEWGVWKKEVDRYFTGLLSKGFVCAAVLSADWIKADNYAITDDLLTWGDTEKTNPTVTTNSASDVDTESATLNGSLDSLGEESSVDVYFEWGETDSYGNTTTAQSKSSTGSFSETLSLTAGRAYHYRAVVTDGTDIWYGEDQQFITVIPARVYGESRLLSDALEWDPSAFYAPPMQTESSLRASVQIGLYVSAPAVRGMAMLKTTGAQAQRVFAAPALSAESRLLASAIFDIQIPAPVIESESRLHAETKVRNWPPELTESQNISTSRRPFAIAYDGRTAFDMGPVRRKDGSEGLYARAWRLRVEGDDCWLAVANEENDEWIEDFIEFSLDDSTGANSFDLTFDQNGRPFACWEQDGRVWIYYYDPVAEEMTKRDVCAGRTPRARLDVRRDRLSGQSDILLFYLDDDEDCLKYRVQRDRYDDAYAISGFNDVENKYLEILAMASNRRLYLWYSIYDPADDFWVLCCWHSAPYPYVAEDENLNLEYDVLSGSVVQVFIPYEAPREDLEISDYSVLSAVIASVMKEYTTEDENIEITGFTIEGSHIRVSMIVYEADAEKLTVADYDTLGCDIIVKILTDDMEDEAVSVEGYSIQSAYVA